MWGPACSTFFFFNFNDTAKSVDAAAVAAACPPSVGESWKELERVGKSWRELERVGESWRESVVVGGGWLVVGWWLVVEVAIGGCNWRLQGEVIIKGYAVSSKRVGVRSDGERWQ